MNSAFRAHARRLAARDILRQRLHRLPYRFLLLALVGIGLWSWWTATHRTSVARIEFDARYQAVLPLLLPRGVLQSDGLTAILDIPSRPGTVRADRETSLMDALRAEVAARWPNLGTLDRYTYTEEYQPSNATLLTRTLLLTGIALGLGFLSVAWLRFLLPAPVPGPTPPPTPAPIVTPVSPSPPPAPTFSVSGRLTHQVRGALGALRNLSTWRSKTHEALGRLRTRIEGLETRPVPVPPPLPPSVPPEALSDLKSLLVGRLDSLGKTVDQMAAWQGKWEPVLENQRTRRAESEIFARRVANATRRSAGDREAPEPIGGRGEENFELGWAKLAENLGIPRDALSPTFCESIRDLARRLRTPDVSFALLEGWTGVGKSPVARSIPWFYHARDSEFRWKELSVGPHWLPTSLAGEWDAESATLREGWVTRAILDATEHSGSHFVFADEGNELPDYFGELFASLKDALLAKDAPRWITVPGFHEAIRIPDGFRMIMAVNPKSGVVVERCDVTTDGSMQERVHRFRIPSLDLKDEIVLLRRWLANPTGFDPARGWEHFEPRIREAAAPWVPRVCRCVDELRAALTLSKDPGWNFVQQGTQLPRRLLREGMRSPDPTRIGHVIEDQIIERIVIPVRTQIGLVRDPGRIALAGKLKAMGFRRAGGELD